MGIALKESSETEYWLMLLKDSDYLESQNFNKLIGLNQELIKMLVSTINTMKLKP